MRHVVNLAIKLALFAVVLGIILSRTPAYSLGNILWLAVVISLLAYFIGDLWILPSYGNWTAVGADAVLVALSLWILPGILGTPPLGFGTILLIAVVLGIGEVYYHRYLQGELMVRTSPVGPRPEAGPDDALTDAKEND